MEKGMYMINYRFISYRSRIQVVTSTTQFDCGSIERSRTAHRKLSNQLNFDLFFKPKKVAESQIQFRRQVENSLRSLRYVFRQ